MTTTKIEIIAVIENVIRLKRDTLGPDLLSDLTNELTRENPQYQMMLRMKQSNPQKFQYAKMPSAKIESIFADDTTVYVPRGSRPLIEELAQKYDQTIKWFDETLVFDRDPEMRLVDGIKLTKYQSSNLAQPCIEQMGVIEMPCGGGKTVMGIALAMTLAQPTLILVHTNDLLNQWLRELRDKAIVPKGLGQWGGGKKVRGHVTVATIQTLTRMPAGDLQELLSHFGCVILDECHHCPADTFLGIMNLCPARYRYGFTATRKRKDGLHFLMHDTIGPVVVHVDDGDLEKAGRSQSVRVREIRTTFYTKHTADQWTQLLGVMVADTDRNSLIINNVVESWKEGHFPLILSDRVGHCRHLCRELQKHGMNARLLVGEVPKEQRNQIVDEARNNLVDAIVATKVADEGLDIPQLSCIHLTTPTANEGKLKQRIGRIRRPVEGKESVVYDYLDSRVSACQRMGRDRRRFYRHWGFKSN